MLHILKQLEDFDNSALSYARGDMWFSRSMRHNMCASANEVM